MRKMILITAAAAAAGSMMLGCAATERLEPISLTSGVLFDYEPINVLGAAAPPTLSDASGPTRRGLRRTIHLAEPSLRACFEDARVANPLMPGAFDVWMTAQPDGSISHITLDPAVEAPGARFCFTSTLSKLTLPAATDGPLQLGLRLRMDYADPPDITTYTLDPVTIDASPLPDPTWSPDAGGGLGFSGTLTFDPVDDTLVDRWKAYDTALEKTYEGAALCYDEALRENPDLRGRVTATFKLRANGAIDTLAFDTNTTGSPIFTACIRRAAVGWAFGLPPAPGALVSMSWLFESSSSSAPAASDDDAPEEHIPANLRGTLSKETVQDVLRQHHGAIRGCYQGGLTQNPELVGEARIDLWIHGESGTVTSATVAQSSFPDDFPIDVAGCAANALTFATFPGAPKLPWTRVSLPLIFSLR